MNRRVRQALVLGLILFAGTFVFAGPQLTRPARSDSPANRILARELDYELGRAQRPKYQQPLSSGVVYALLQGSGDLDARANAAPIQAQRRRQPDTEGCSRVFTGGGNPNTRVNQDCSLRRQAEEVIAISPLDSSHLIVGMNDSRIGFNHCGYAWSFNDGRTWGDMTPPFWNFLLADGHTSDACSDPTATFDADGNAYIGGVLFDIASPASAFVVAKSHAGIDGQFYHSPADLPFQEYRTDPLGVIASDNDPNVFHDKEFIVADANAGSPKRNNVYATWSRFAITDEGVGANSPIYFSQSSDGGATWSRGIKISGANPEICTDFSGSVNRFACDQDQGSHPIVGPDGTIYVAFGNGNTPEAGFNQVLFVKCAGTADCTNPDRWSDPVKVGDLIGTHPFGPDPTTGCPDGRQCLPPNGYRVPEFTSITTSVAADGTLFVSWADFRNGGPSCNPLGNAATATPPCDNDVFYAYSDTNGRHWSDTIDVTPASELGASAQWQPWSTVSPDGRSLWVAFYDRHYGDCEFTGCNDITLAEVRNPASGEQAIRYDRLTTSSMPNLVPANNPVQAGFLGDYMWVALDDRDRPHVVWADTRGRGDTVEEDIYFTRVP